MFVVILLFVSSIFAVVAQDDGADILDTIIVEYPGLMPEGIEYDPLHGRFLLGSGPFTGGTIFGVELDGTITPLIEDDDLTMTLGLHIDHANNRLLAVNMDPALMTGAIPDFSKMALAAYDLETLERLYFTSLAPLAQDGGFLLTNDVTVDANGNAYVTDSASPTIYKVDTEGNASIFVRDERLQAAVIDEQVPTNAMNGIDYHPDGYLLVAVISGEIYRVPLDDPGELTRVEIGAPIVIDGMILSSEQEMVAAAVLGEITTPQAAEFYVVRLVSDDGWETATLENQLAVDDAAATVTTIDDIIYAIQPQFDNPMSERYTILSVRFEDTE